MQFIDSIILQVYHMFSDEESNFVMIQIINYATLDCILESFSDV